MVCQKAFGGSQNQAEQQAGPSRDREAHHPFFNERRTSLGFLSGKADHTLHPVAAQHDDGEVHRVQELDRVAHRVEERQLIYELIKNGVSAERQQQGDQAQPGPEQDHPLFSWRVEFRSFLQGEQDCTKCKQHHDDPGVFARAGVARKELALVSHELHQLLRFLIADAHDLGEFTGQHIALSKCSDDFLHLLDALNHRILPDRAPIVAALE